MPRTVVFFSRIAMYTLAAACLTIVEPLCHGQSSSASLSVSVIDTTGAALTDAEVILNNSETNQEQHATSGKTGNATFAFLKPGQYGLKVSKPEFAEVSVGKIVLNVGDEKRLRLVLKVGSANETVSVDGSGLTINTVDGSVSTIIDRTFVENIPLNGRSFQSLLLLTPGVVTNNPQTGSGAGQSGEFSVNGQRTESNVYTVDGVSANTGGYTLGYGTPGTSGSVAAATALGTTQSLVSVDALQEVRVSSSSYSAEFGLSPGGQFSFDTRSGTNETHGTAFDYLRNNYFDANDWFNDNLGIPISALRQNDFGGTFGGPVRLPKLYNGKDKSFFFFSYEGLRLKQPSAAVINYVPTLALRQMAPAALQPVLNAFPVPTGAEVTVPCDGYNYLCPPGQPIGTEVPSGLAAFVKGYSLPSAIDSTSVRFDQQITARLRAFFRFSDTQSSTETRLLSQLNHPHQSSFTNTLGLTGVISNHITDEFRLNYTSNVGGSASVLDSFGGGQPVNLLQLQGLSSPSAYFGFDLLFGSFEPSLEQGTVTQPQHAWNIVDSLSIAHGRQTIKVGINYRRTGSRVQQTTPTVLVGFESSQQVLQNSSPFSLVETTGASYPVYTNTGLYFQDEVRVRPRLGFSLGLRWEVNPPPSQSSGTLPYIAQGDLSTPASLTLAPAGTSFWKTTYHNFAPRLGVTYQANTTPGRETVVRAGEGVFFDSGQQASTQAFGNSPGQQSSAYYFGTSFPLTPAQLNVPITNPPTPQYSITYYFPTRLQLPYTLQWNLSVEQALGKSQALTFSYVGSNGRRLLSQQQLEPNTATFQYIMDETSGTTSDYDALQLQFQRTLSRGLQVLASYNWAHSIDYGSQNIDFAQIRGNSDFDLRHNFNAAISYDIPYDASNKIVKSLTNQWGIDGRVSARTGFPVILNGNEITGANGQISYSGLNLMPNVPVYIQVPGIAGNRQINPAAFSLPKSGQMGDAPRNFARGFGANQVDMEVHRTFPLGEAVKLQFRAETFNILNHPNFGYIQPNYGDPQFGQATEMLDHSLGTLNPLYQQGGPRSMQFALKLLF
jgi:hypothetical protein